MKGAPRKPAAGSRLRAALSRLSRLAAALGGRTPALPAAGGERDGQSRRVIERLAAGVAHDLNNILLVLQGYAEMAVEEPDSGPGARALLEEMRTATARASRLVQDLQVIGGRGTGTLRLLDLAAAVRRSLPALRSACPPGFEIRLSLDRGLPLVQADEELVARMLTALCARAREVMPDGGEILVRASATGSSRSPGVYLAVTDAGGPLTDEMRGRMFEPYLPGPGGTKGQGLGMSVVQAAARRLGGEVLVRSQPGGTTVEVRLPAGVDAEETETRAGSSSAGQPGSGGPAASSTDSTSPGSLAIGSLSHGSPSPGSPSPAGPRTILLAEDDDSLRALAVKVLTREGYTVIAARDGQEAVEIFDREGPSIHLVLADDVMPRLGGRAALDRIQEKAPLLPVILCSGYSWNLDAPASRAAGRCQTLTKPWQPRDLLRTVREGLEQRP